MIVSQLAVKSFFVAEPMVLIIKLTSRYCMAQLHKEALCMIALMCHTQAKLEKLDKRQVMTLN